jgi:hypothetical protein
MVNGDRYIELAAVQKLRYALEMKKINDNLLEQLASSLKWLLHYSEKYQIPLPEKDRIIALIDRAIELENQLPTNPNRLKNQPESEQNHNCGIVRFTVVPQWLFGGGW